MTPPRCGFAAPPQVGATSGPAKPDPRLPLAEITGRVDALESTFRHIATTRMAGVPVLNSALQVRAVGFAPQPDAPGWLCGVLVTPWFMNLLRLPLRALEDPAQAAASGCLDVGRDAGREIGGQALHFVGAFETRLGHFEQCSLYSPMFHFADQAAAVATAAEVMKLLHQPPAAAPSVAPPCAASAAPVATPETAVRPARRGFLLGRRTGDCTADAGR